MNELVIDAEVRRGSRGMNVRRVQEWLSLHGLHVAVDEKFGPATEAAVCRFQEKNELRANGVVAEATFAKLVAPMARATASMTADGRRLGTLVTAYARQHLKEKPREVAGQNRGPWVRLYMDGHEGEAWPWCAGFACFVLKQACATLGVPVPISASFSCDSLAASAKDGGIFVTEAHARNGTRVSPGDLFLSRRTASDWVHTGIVLRATDEIFETIEGNTNDEGSREGYEVCQRLRGYDKKDFIDLA